MGWKAPVKMGRGLLESWNVNEISFKYQLDTNGHAIWIKIVFIMRHNINAEIRLEEDEKVILKVTQTDL